jgi:subtilisin family serine protease
MKKLILAFSLLIAFCAVFAMQFDPDLFVSKSVLTCFTKTAIGNDTGKIDFTLENGFVKTGLASFDLLSAKYHIVDMQQMHPDISHPEWNDNGLYIQNTYRLILDSNNQIDAAVAELSKDGNLIYAELEGIVRSYFTPNDPMITSQYTHARIQSYDAWDYIQGSHDVTIAITDSGVKWNHPDLRANIWINPQESPGMTINWDAGTISGGDGVDQNGGAHAKIDDLVGWDFYNNDNNPIQTYAANDHGTHVAGCAAAVGNNSIGVSGTSPIASIICCKGASNTSPSTGISYAYDQILYAADLGADIINASWGSTGTGTYPNSIINYANTLGSLVVVAAGNANTEHTTAYQDYPADCTNALCVGATGQNDVKASFSDYGASIDVCAPGEGILSTIISNNSYDSYDGTSMASPVTAGVCAMVKAMNPDLTPGQLLQRMRYSADYIDDINSNYAGLLGGGRINAFSATMYDKIPKIVIDDKSVEEFSGDGDGVPNPGEVARLKVALNNYLNPFTGLAWLTAENLQATLTCSYPGVTIIDGTANFGTLSAGSTMWNNNQPFKFQTVGTLPSEPIPFELVVSANPTAPYPYTRSLPFTVELSLIQHGWPYNVGGASTSSPILVNLDAEPDKEVVFGDQAGNIHAMKADGITELPNFPLPAGSAIVGSLSMADINNDGLLEFACSLQNNTIFVFNQNGNPIWSLPAGGTLRTSPIIASLGLNATKQIITATQTGNLFVLNSDGTYYPNFPAAVGGAVLGPPTVADLNGDGLLEILVATLNGNLCAISSTTGTNIAGFPVALAGGSQNPITVANIDADTNPEILINTSTAGYVLAYNHDGSQLWQKNVGGQIKTGPVVADVNNDGNKEIICIGASGIVNILTTAGTNLPNTPININQGTECTPTVARFDNDNYAGIIFGDSNGMLHSVRADGTESPNFPIDINGNIKISSALGDIDQDGDFDIVIPNDAGFYTIDIKRPAQEILWQCYMATYNRSGNIYQSTPNNDNNQPPVVTTLHENYPNPFNPETTISFDLGSASPVNIVIYNQKGQIVRTLVNNEMPAGKHHVVWNGRDDNGSPVSSGIYFFKMFAGKYSNTRKMVMMK